ncbi:MAG: dephospho-CoA kinase [Candidatus Marinimicrobia bacterium]|nr:dephospho-CoA kinase [Candidatus Neomarinimicrobiota bacterium]MCF7829257.1 dephospho-CoA kinase [Candidatus Neomarinimicrobiota bacterium]MCF7881090.1 dephospho-CoA kinase [Candidatus Neomarinimicrobiota bacterium]
MFIVGVTGGIGSGKSTVSQMLKDRGAYIFDADTVAKELIDSNEELQQELIDEFMDDIIDDAGNIVKSKLARIGFSNQANQEMLNAIIHPYVFRANDEQIEQVRQRGNVDLYVVDAPLLFESGMDMHNDYNILVYTRLKLRLERAQKRGTLSRDEIIRRLDLQMPEEEKMELADFIIDNNGTEEDLRREVDRVYNEIMR